MQRAFPLYALIVIVICGVFSSLLPYPVFSKYTNITKSDMYTLNNFYESEREILSPEKKVSLSNLNWFDTVNTMFKTYQKTRVIDMETGLEYYVYRNGGHNHADVEPIDEKNTQIFKQIYGGVWSWARRPAYVELGEGNFVAASINGYPHGKSYVPDNGMDGHTCIHFLMSKTHGTNRVDEGHQAAIEKAMKNGKEILKTIKQ